MAFCRLLLVSLCCIAAVQAIGWSSNTGGPQQMNNLTNWKSSSQTTSWSASYFSAAVRKVVPSSVGVIVSDGSVIETLATTNGYATSVLYPSYFPILEMISVPGLTEQLIVRSPSTVVSYSLYSSSYMPTTWSSPLYQQFSSIAACQTHLYGVSGTYSPTLYTYRLTTGDLLATTSLTKACNLTCNPLGGVFCMSSSGLYQFSYTSYMSERSLYPTSSYNGGNSLPATTTSGQVVFFQGNYLTMMAPNVYTSSGWCASGIPCLVWSSSSPFYAVLNQTAVDEANGWIFVLGSTSSQYGSTTLWSVSLATGTFTASSPFLHPTNSLTMTVNPTAGVIAFTNLWDTYFYTYNKATGSIGYPTGNALDIDARFPTTMAAGSGFLVGSVGSGCVEVRYTNNYAKFPAECGTASAHHLAVWAILLIVLSIVFCCVCVIVCCIKKRRSGKSYNAMLAEGIPVGIVTGNAL